MRHKTLNSIIAPAFVINLDARQDRWQQMTELLNSLGLSAYERFPAIAPDIHAPAHQETLNKLKNFSYEHSGIPLSHDNSRFAGTLGCLLSHIAVIQIAKARNYPSVLILEDDITLTSYARERLMKSEAFLAKRDSWDMFFLGGKPSKGYHEIRQKNGAVRKIEGLKLAHAYFVNASAYDALIKGAMAYGWPLDWFYAYVMQKNHRCFKIHPDICYQLDGYSDIGKSYVHKRRKRRQKFNHLFYCLARKWR